MKRKAKFPKGEAVSIYTDYGSLVCVHRGHHSRAAAADLIRKQTNARPFDESSLTEDVARYLCRPTEGMERPGYLWGMGYKEGSPGAIPLWILETGRDGSWNQS